jgi:hypothetical protein
VTVPILEDDDLIHRAVLWRALGDGGDGQPTYSAPDEVFVQWSERRRRTVDADGTPIALDAQARLGQDEQPVALGSKLWLAPDPNTDALSQWYGTGSAGQADEVMVVATRSRSWDMKGIEVGYTLGLTWWRDAT